MKNLVLNEEVDSLNIAVVKKSCSMVHFKELLF